MVLNYEKKIDELDFFEICQMLGRSWRLILISILIFLSVAGIYIFNSIPVYKITVKYKISAELPDYYIGSGDSPGFILKTLDQNAPSGWDKKLYNNEFVVFTSSPKNKSFYENEMVKVAEKSASQLYSYVQYENQKVFNEMSENMRATEFAVQNFMRLGMVMKLKSARDPLIKFSDVDIIKVSPRSIMLLIFSALMGFIFGAVVSIYIYVRRLKASDV